MNIKKVSVSLNNNNNNNSINFNHTNKLLIIDLIMSHNQHYILQWQSHLLKNE